MRFPALQPGTFLERVNRFAALVEVDGREVLAHVANSGRLKELLKELRPVLLAPRPAEGRRTAFDLALVRLPSGLVSADARLPPRLVQEAFLARRLPPFREYATAQREVRYGESRLDLVFRGGAPDCMVEVKSVTLVEQGRGLFPDAPTERGRKHLRTLALAQREGYRAAVVFVIQRADVEAFRPHDGADPAFGEELRRVAGAGVEVFAYRCRVTRRGIGIASGVPVLL